MDAINTPRPFDWMTFGITVLVAVIPVGITIWLWRKDRASLVAAADRARRGEIHHRASELYGEFLEALARDELWRLTPRKHQLMAAIVSLAEPSDDPAIEWIQITSVNALDMLGVDALFREPIGRRDISAADDIVLRAITPIERWARDPDSVDFGALSNSEEWAQMFVDGREQLKRKASGG